jgi:hypothetical protein
MDFLPAVGRQQIRQPEAWLKGMEASQFTLFKGSLLGRAGRFPPEGGDFATGNVFFVTDCHDQSAFLQGLFVRGFPSDAKWLASLVAKPAARRRYSRLPIGAPWLGWTIS